MTIAAAPLAEAAGAALLKLLAPAAGAILLIASGFAAGEVYEHKAPWGLYESRQSARKDVATWKSTAAVNAATAASWAASFHKSEAQRVIDQKAAAAAIDTQAKTLDARVETARRSAVAVHTLISKDPPHDTNGCPARRLLDHDSLRDALDPGASR